MYSHAHYFTFITHLHTSQIKEGEPSVPLVQSTHTTTHRSLHLTHPSHPPHSSHTTHHSLLQLNTTFIDYSTNKKQKQKSRRSRTSSEKEERKRFSPVFYFFGVFSEPWLSLHILYTKKHNKHGAQVCCAIFSPTFNVSSVLITLILARVDTKPSSSSSCSSVYFCLVQSRHASMIVTGLPVTSSPMKLGNCEKNLENGGPYAVEKTLPMG